MTESDFWGIINLSCQKTGNIPFQQSEQKARYLIEILSGLSEDDLVDFEKTVRLKIIETRRYYNFTALYEIIDGPFISDDCYLYFQYTVVFQGKQIYEAALYDPDTLYLLLERDSEIHGECFMYLADTAYEMKFGHSNSEDQYPTAQVAAMNLSVSREHIGKVWTEDSLPIRFPNLWFKFRK